jgi:hypothetical protein
MKSRSSATPKGDALTELNAAQVVSLLTCDGKLLKLGYCSNALAPHHTLHRIGRGRLRGQLLECSPRTWVGARGGGRQQVGEPEPGLQFSIHVERGLRSTGQNRLCTGFDDFTDSDVDLATLAANLLAHFTPTAPTLPLFLHVSQNWKKGYAPTQVIRLTRSEALARRLIDYLATAYRWNLDEQPDFFAPAQAPRPTHQPAAVPDSAAASDPPAFLTERERGYYAQYPAVRGLFG